MNADDPLDAGDFTSWLHGMQATLRGDHAAEVPCNGCTACCTSALFIHIEPDEADTLAHIPPQLLFPAPRRPPGHMVLGHDERGHCPMLVDGACSIYEHRPRTCRTYDCRIFSATGLDATDGDRRKAAIDERVSRWSFTYARPSARAQHAALQATAVAIRRQVPDLRNAEVAVRAVMDPETPG